MQNSPASQNKNMGVYIFLIVIVAAGFGFFWMFWPEIRADQILKKGLPAEATIVSIEPTGNVYNNQPQVRLTLQVASSTNGTFKTQAVMIINPVYIPQFQPGKLVHIKYDPKDPTKAAIEEVQN